MSVLWAWSHLSLCFWMTVTDEAAQVGRTNQQQNRGSLSQAVAVTKSVVVSDQQVEVGIPVPSPPRSPPRSLSGTDSSPVLFESSSASSLPQRLGLCPFIYCCILNNKNKAWPW